METELAPDCAADRFSSRLRPTDCMVVAISGGSDSTALLHLMHNRRRDLPRLVAVTVDHGLRAGSAQEALRVAALCDRLGIEHRTMRWAGRKPKKGIQEAARLARYDLLRRCARSIGAGAVITGHTSDDQIETAIMRGERGTGRGLAGMAEAMLHQGDCWILRPLLAVRRSALRSMLSASGIGWTEDPSNADERFERTRLRQSGTSAPDSEILSMVGQAAEARRHDAGLLARFVEAHVHLHGGIVAEMPQVPPEFSEHQQQAIGLFASLMGGRAHRPGAQQQARIARFTADVGPPRTNVAGSMLDRRADRIFVYRERRGQSRQMLQPGKCLIWDGRYRFCNDGHGERFVIAPTRGAERATRLRTDAGDQARQVPRGVVSRAFGGEPTILAETGHNLQVRETLPDGISWQRHLALFDLFLPEFDLTLANKCAGLFDRTDYPAMPLS